MSKGPAAAALLSAPKEAEATEPVYRVVSEKAITNLIPVVRMDCPSTDHAVINARRANRKIDIPFLGQVDLLGASSRFRLTMGA